MRFSRGPAAVTRLFHLKERGLFSRIMPLFRINLEWEGSWKGREARRPAYKIITSWNKGQEPKQGATLDSIIVKGFLLCLPEFFLSATA